MELGTVIHAFNLEMLLKRESLVGGKMCHEDCIGFNFVLKIELDCWLLKKQIWCASRVPAAGALLLLLAFNNWDIGDLIECNIKIGFKE
jgi:hypothetical protein